MKKQTSLMRVLFMFYILINIENRNIMLAGERTDQELFNRPSAGQIDLTCSIIHRGLVVRSERSKSEQEKQQMR